MKVFLDTDLNFPSDDFQALMLLLAEDEVDIVGCGAAAGNTWAEEVFANIKEAARVLELGELAVFRGRRAPDFAADREMALRAERNGVRRFIGAHAKAPAPRPWVIGDQPDGDAACAAEAIIDLSHRHRERLVLVCLGPPSNLARSLRRDPTLPERLRSVIVMGGHFSTPSDPKGRVDFNFWFDPQAAQTVLNAGIEILLVPLDVCHQAGVTETLVDRCARFDRNRAALFVDDFLEMIRQHGPSMALADQLVALLCPTPELIVSEQRGRVEVDSSDTGTRGRSTLVPDRTGLVRVVRRVDIAGAHDRMVRLVERMSGQACRPFEMFGTPAYRYFFGLRLAHGPVTTLEIGYDRRYRIEGIREIRTISDFARSIAPLAQIIVRAKRRAELWPPSPRVDAIIDRAPAGESIEFDPLAWKELEHILFERFMAVRAMAVIMPGGGPPRGFSCVSKLNPARRRFLRYQFATEIPADPLLAEFSYVEPRSSGLWASEVLGSCLFHWYAATQSSAASFPILAIAATSQEASRRRLAASGFEPIAEHTIPHGPEQGRVLILHRLILDRSTRQKLRDRCDAVGVHDLAALAASPDFQRVWVRD